MGISTKRDILRERITRRTYQMLADGVVSEITRLGQKYNWQGEALKGNIYRIFKGVVDGTKDQGEAIEEFIRSDMALAKRQMTWFKRNPHIVWSDNPDELMDSVDTFLRHRPN